MLEPRGRLSCAQQQLYRLFGSSRTSRAPAGSLILHRRTRNGLHRDTVNLRLAQCTPYQPIRPALTGSGLADFLHTSRQGKGASADSGTQVSYLLPLEGENQNRGTTVTYLPQIRGKEGEIGRIANRSSVISCYPCENEQIAHRSSSIWYSGPTVPWTASSVKARGQGGVLYGWGTASCGCAP